MSDQTEAFETPADAGKGEAGEVRLWKEAIALQRKAEDTWRKRARDAVARYRDEERHEGANRRFNILFANTQTALPAIYNATPIPDIRRRFGDADEIGKVVSQVLERAVSFQADAHDFDAQMRAACWDMEVPGRGAVRVRYEPTFSDDVIADEAVPAEYVDWRDFIRGPGRRWSEVPWIAFEHRLTREELREKFGPAGGTMPLDIVETGAERDDPRDVPDVFKRGTVWEVWDKQTRRVLFLAQSLDDRFLSKSDDPLGLRDFFPVPRPLYSVQDSGSLVPLVPYDLYRDQAEELDRVTARITALVAMVKWRGLYAADMPEMNDLTKAADGEFKPVQNWQQVMQLASAGGLDNALWIVPTEKLMLTIKELVQHRDEIKQVIYEITGLSDIIRGATQASETATAQRIKSQWGSLRIEDRQAEVRRFARDLVRLQAEIIAEKFQPQTLAMMTGVNLPTAEQKARAQQALMMAHQSGQQPGQEVAQAAQLPSWDDVLRVLRSDAMRSYRVDIETDSTVQADVMRAQENAAKFVEGFGGFVAAIGPAVQARMMPMDVAADLITAFSRNFKLGRSAEDAIERLKGVQMPPQADPAAAEQARAQAAAQMRQAEMAQQAQIERDKLAAAERMKMAEIEARAMTERERMDREDARHVASIEAEREKFAAEIQMRAVESDRSAEMEREKLASGERMQTESARIAAAPDQQTTDQVTALAEGVRHMAEGVHAAAQGMVALGEHLSQAVEATAQAVSDELSAPVEAIRGADGRIAQVKRGKRVMTVTRGDDGKATGIN